MTEEHRGHILEQAPIPALVVDDQRRVRRANRAALRLVGQSASAVLGRRGGEALRCLHSADDAKGCGFGDYCATCPVRQAILDTLSTGRGVDRLPVDFPRQGRRGVEILKLRLSTTRLDNQGEPSVLLYLEDETDAARAQDALDRLRGEMTAWMAVAVPAGPGGQGAEAASLCTMAAGLAHRSNNLLQASLGEVELGFAKLEPGSLLGGALKRLRDQLINSADMIRRLVAFTGHLPMARQPVDLAGLVNRERRHWAEAMPTDVALLIKLPDQAPTVTGDAGHLGQALGNLVHNAAEAMTGKTGTVVISLARLGPADDPARGLCGGVTLGRGPFVRLEVADQGKGLDEVVLARAWQPFFTSNLPGRGLGLAEAWGIARAHGGGLGLDGTPGGGARAWLVLPETTGPRLAE